MLIFGDDIAGVWEPNVVDTPLGVQSLRVMLRHRITHGATIFGPASTRPRQNDRGGALIDPG